MEPEDEERFWSKVEKTDTCWNWIGCKNKDGYGAFRLQGRTWGVHRLMWTHLYGTIDKGLDVRHKCTGKCVNPEHLQLGTHQDNIDDKIRDGTVAKGEKHGLAKLTRQYVDEIRASTASCRELGRNYGVCESTIYHIKNGKTWK
jgi:hypothetical protein